MTKFGLFWAALCLVAALATACGGSSSTTKESQSGTATATASPTGSAPATASAATITIANMSFGDAITVSPGARVTVKNNDSAEHSVTSDTAGQFDVDVESKGQGTLTAPTAPGDYAFHCKYHPSMKSTLTVK
jgi:plastocyanin